MDALAVTSITNFILAGEVLFLAGMLVQMPKDRFSAAWFWSAATALLGLAALTGGIDHGFFESRGLPRYFVQRATWLILGAMTFSILMTAAAQYFSPRAQRIILIAGIVQFAAYATAALAIDSFLVVIVNYAPVMVLWLGLNIAGLGRGEGSWQMVAGILLLFAATAIQALKVDVFSPLDHNGLYHLLSMVAVVFLYLGGRHLRAARETGL